MRLASRLVVGACTSRPNITTPKIDNFHASVVCHTLPCFAARVRHNMSLWRLAKELRRRRVFRVAGFYFVGAWVLLQVGDVVPPSTGEVRGKASTAVRKKGKIHTFENFSIVIGGFLECRKVTQ